LTLTISKREDWTVTENRAHKRYKVDMLDITAAIIQTSNIKAIDISLNGVSLNVTRRLNIGEQYDLKLQSRGKTLNLRGVVIWAKISKIQSGSNGDIIPVYTAGLEFIDVSRHLRDGIDHFIKTHKRDGDIRNSIRDDTVKYDLKGCSRCYPRFKVNTPAEAFITDQTQCLPVQDLSFGGLRLKCSRAMKINSEIPMILNFLEDRFIVFKGRVTSCRLIKKASPRLYTIGIAISEMSMKDRKTLSEHIRLLSNIDTSPSQ
jgi:hypothetical protein